MPRSLKGELNSAEPRNLSKCRRLYLLHLRDDFEEVSEARSRRSFDYLLIESTGISEPIPVAQTFTFEDENGVSLSHVSRLDTMVTVVDANSFLNDYNEAESLQSRESLGEEDNRTVTDLLIDQIEFADVIVLNKFDLVTEEQASEVEAIINALNPGAEIIATRVSKFHWIEVLDTKLFDYDKAESPAGWFANSKESTPQKPKNTASRVSRIAKSRPFDARRVRRYHCRQKFWWRVEGKGFFWSGCRSPSGLSVCSGRRRVERQPRRVWWAAVDQEAMDIPEESRPDNQADWHDHYGDRKQMLVFIGQDMDEAMQGMLDHLLASPLAEAEFAQWEGRENPRSPPLVLPDEEAAEDESIFFNLRVRFQEWSRHLVPRARMREAKATRISRCSEVEGRPPKI